MAPNINGNLSPRCLSPVSTEGSSDDSAHIGSIESTVSHEHWFSQGLVIVVVGASGDLAKKKTYPSLFKLYNRNLLPPNTIIWGYARSSKTHDGLRSQIKPYLMKLTSDEAAVDNFLSQCFYHSGQSYGDADAFSKLASFIQCHEESFPQKSFHNRLFYLAIPPNVFNDASIAIKQEAMTNESAGWTRIIIEKPFGRDLESCLELSTVLGKHFDEEHLYRIDHYLGKEMVQNILPFRCGNSWLEWMWNKNAVKCVLIEFKEPFGTEGRGGYFDQYGIIRDVIQNHLLQVLTLLAMELPIDDSDLEGDHIRDAKVEVLQSIPAISLEDCLLGQYEGYTSDPTITNKSSNCPTFAAVKCFVNTPRWHGVPFIMTAGKALDERKVDVRIQFKDGPDGVPVRRSSSAGRGMGNELVMRIQPDESIYMSTTVKAPGFSSAPVRSSMSLNYSDSFDNLASSDAPPDAYTRLILDVLRGKHGSFVRGDELERSWEIFTPLLKEIEKGEVRPITYQYGSAGPHTLDDFIRSHGGCDSIFDDGSKEFDSFKREMMKSSL